jgi:hypothetical protein
MPASVHIDALDMESIVPNRSELDVTQPMIRTANVAMRRASSLSSKWRAGRKFAERTVLGSVPADRPAYIIDVGINLSAAQALCVRRGSRWESSPLCWGSQPSALGRASAARG